LNKPVNRMSDTAAPQARLRQAVIGDIGAIVRMLADDPLGSLREKVIDPVPDAYLRAFEAITQDQNNELVVIETPDGSPIAVLQLTVTPYLTHQGGWRASIEGVRVDRRYRGLGLGRELLDWAINRAQERGCHVVQLTTDKQRPQAKGFYESMGFVATHEGMKLKLPATSQRRD
jgi:ribosomal protein S18 acetylase RimI-like enzyme